MRIIDDYDSRFSLQREETLLKAILRRMMIAYLEGQGDLVSRFIVGLAGATPCLIGSICTLTKSP